MQSKKIFEKISKKICIEFEIYTNFAARKNQKIPHMHTKLTPAQKLEIFGTSYYPEYLKELKIQEILAAEAAKKKAREPKITIGFVLHSSLLILLFTCLIVGLTASCLSVASLLEFWQFTKEFTSNLHKVSLLFPGSLVIGTLLSIFKSDE